MVEDREAWRAAFHGIVNNQITAWLNNSNLYLDSSQSQISSQNAHELKTFIHLAPKL